jgi:hypothetical protein
VGICGPVPWPVPGAAGELLVEVAVPVPASVVVAVVVGPGVGVPVVVGVTLPVGDGLASAHVARVMTLLSSETWPLRASTRPWTFAPVCTVMLVNARTLPTKLVPVPRVAELPTCQ